MNVKNKKGTMNFGEHFMIDGYLGNYRKLNDKNLVGKILEKLPDQMGMKKLSKAHIFSAPCNEIKDPGGWSGFVVIAESHISIHTFPARGFLSMDVYTCKNGLDTDMIEKHIVDSFDLKDAEINFIKRGKKYPSLNITNFHG